MANSGVVLFLWFFCFLESCKFSKIRTGQTIGKTGVFARLPNQEIPKSQKTKLKIRSSFGFTFFSEFFRKSRIFKNQIQPNHRETGVFAGWQNQQKTKRSENNKKKNMSRRILFNFLLRLQRFSHLEKHPHSPMVWPLNFFQLQRFFQHFGEKRVEAKNLSVANPQGNGAVFQDG